MKTQVILHLNLHREYFAAIVAGTKTIEYRDQSPYCLGAFIELTSA